MAARPNSLPELVKAELTALFGERVAFHRAECRLYSRDLAVLPGLAFRVPVPTVSVVDFVTDLNKEVTVKQVNQAFKATAEGPLAGIL